MELEQEYKERNDKLDKLVYGDASTKKKRRNSNEPQEYSDEKLIRRLAN